MPESLFTTKEPYLCKVKILVVIFSLLFTGLQAIDTAVLIDQTFFTEDSCCEDEGGSCCEEEEACADFCCRAAMSMQIHSVDYPRKERNNFSLAAEVMAFYVPSAPDVLSGFRSIPEQPPKSC